MKLVGAIISLLLAAAPAGAKEQQQLVFALDVMGHLPSATPIVAPERPALALAELRPVVHEVAASWGVLVPALSLETVMRVGLRFATGELPAGSVVGNEPATRYSLTGVPITAGLRMTFLHTRVKPLLGVDAGGAVSRASYERTGAATVGGSWAWQWELRGLLGVHVDLWRWLSARAFFDGRWAQAVMVERGPDVEPTGIGFGLALVATVTPAALSSLASADGEVEDGRLRDYGPAPSDGLEVAFALIRDGDEAAKKRDFIKAEDCYRRGLGRLPQDGETQRNVAAPVHVDWARALVEIGRTAEARRALDRALEIVPEFEAARLMLERLPMPNR